jgi:Na+/proline symporter
MQESVTTAQERVQQGSKAMFGLEPIIFWGWLFFILYMWLMVGFGFIGMSRVQNSDDFATARGGYGPVFLALAMTATSAPGATFLGMPALAYSAGISSLWQLLYPFGVYIGVWVSMAAIRRGGEAFGSRTIPEYLGDRYKSDALRLMTAGFSMLLLIYLAGQLLSAAVMFYNLLGLETFPALMITAFMLMGYVAIGGADADILSDGVQGALMLVLAVFVLYMFLTGFGVEEGGLEALDAKLLQPIHKTHPLCDSYWDFLSIFVAHLPSGLLPHIGNKLWALKSDSDQTKFISLSFAFGLQLQSFNPYACPALALPCGVVAMTLVSLFTEKLDDSHLKRVFGD